MKAIGGSDGDIRRIFLIEASAIGFLGGVAGVALGWVVGRAIELRRQRVHPESRRHSRQSVFAAAVADRRRDWILDRDQPDCRQLSRGQGRTARSYPGASSRLTERPLTSGGPMSRSLPSRVLVVLLLAAQPGAGPEQGQGRKRSRDSVPVRAGLPETAAESLSRRRHRRRDQFQGPRVRVHAKRRYAAVRIRSEWHCSCARSARASTASSSRTPSASIATTTSGPSTKARTWSSSSTRRDASRW